MPVEPRWDEIIQGGRGHRPRRRRHRALHFGKGVSLAFVFVLILIIMGAGIFLYAQLRLSANKENVEGLSESAAGKPMNVLVLGSDSREGLSPQAQKEFDPEGTDRKSGQRADTIILLHLDDKRNKAVLVSIPRDLRVTLPNGKSGKVNTAYRQGPSTMVAAVEKLSGLSIHHYVEVNFEGFVDLVDALGGLELYFERPINDKDSGLKVPKGCVELDGKKALSFVRVRKIDSDFERIGRQQLFLRQMIDKVATPGTILNPVKVVKLVNIFSKRVKTDAELSVGEMKRLALSVRDFNAGSVDMRIVPSAPATIRGISYVIANEKQSQALFGAIRKSEPLPDFGRTGVSSIDPEDVRITVLNGTSVNELAKREADSLRSKTYTVEGTGNAASHEKTIVYYKEGSDEKARMVASLYGAATKPAPASLSAPSDVVLVLGKDLVERTQPPQTASPAPRSPGANPSKKPLVHSC